MLSFRRSAGIAGGNKCKFCLRKMRMGEIDEHRCYSKIISISVDRAQLKRVDDLAQAAGMSRSAFMMNAALSAGALSADEQRLLELVRSMKK